MEVIPALLAPLLADHLAFRADAGAESPAGRCCCLAGGWLARLLAIIFVLDGEVTGLRYVCRGKTFRETQQVQLSEVFCEGSEENILGALEQIQLRKFDATDEIKELKLSFLFVLLFAPLQPLLVLPSLLARLLEVRTKLQKVFLVRRRNVPRDARLVHGPQEIFNLLALQGAIFWHLGLALMSYNDSLPSYSLPSLFLAWFGTGFLLALFIFLLYREADRRAWALQLL